MMRVPSAFQLPFLHQLKCRFVISVQLWLPSSSWISKVASLPCPLWRRRHSTAIWSEKINAHKTSEIVNNETWGDSKEQQKAYKYLSRLCRKPTQLSVTVIAFSWTQATPMNNAFITNVQRNLFDNITHTLSLPPPSFHQCQIIHLVVHAKHLAHAFLWGRHIVEIPHEDRQIASLKHKMAPLIKESLSPSLPSKNHEPLHTKNNLTAEKTWVMWISTENQNEELIWATEHINGEVSAAMEPFFANRVHMTYIAASHLDAFIAVC